MHFSSSFCIALGDGGVMHVILFASGARIVQMPFTSLSLSMPSTRCTRLFLNKSLIASASVVAPCGLCDPSKTSTLSCGIVMLNSSFAFFTTCNRAFHIVFLSPTLRAFSLISKCFLLSSSTAQIAIAALTS